MPLIDQTWAVIKLARAGKASSIELNKGRTMARRIQGAIDGNQVDDVLPSSTIVLGRVVISEMNQQEAHNV